MPPARAGRELGWVPAHGLAGGIDETVRYFLAQRR